LACILALRLALCLGFFFVGCSEGPADSPASNASSPARAVHVINVLTEEVRLVTMRDVLVLPGQSEALHDVRLAAQRGGVVDWTGVTAG